MITDNVMKAEFCRQIGEMESAKVILDNTVVDDLSERHCGLHTEAAGGQRQQSVYNK